MRRMMRSILLLVPLLAAVIGYAQQGSDVRFYVQPWKEVEYKLDGVKVDKSISAMHLAAGDHRFVFWAPGRSLLDTIVHVADGRDLLLRKVLAPTPEFRAYDRECKRIWTKKALWKVVPAMVTVGFGLKAMQDRKAHDQAFDDLHAARDQYTDMTSGVNIDRLKNEQIPAAQDELDATRRRMVVSLAICGAGALATVYGFIRAKRYTYPVFEDKERIRFEGMAWMPGPQGGMLLAGLTIPIR